MQVEVVCLKCGKTFLREKKHVNTSKKFSRPIFCSMKCSHLNQQETRSDKYTPVRKMYLHSRCSAKRKFQDFTISLDDLLSTWENQEGRCNLSGVELNIGNTRKEKYTSRTTASLDRKDSSKGYLPDNIQIIHKEINDLKSNWDEDVFIDWCCKIADHARTHSQNFDRTVVNSDSERYSTIDVSPNGSGSDLDSNSDSILEDSTHDWSQG